MPKVIRNFLKGLSDKDADKVWEYLDGGHEDDQ